MKISKPMYTPAEPGELLQKSGVRIAIKVNKEGELDVSGWQGKHENIFHFQVGGEGDQEFSTNLRDDELAFLARVSLLIYTWCTRSLDGSNYNGLIDLIYVGPKAVPVKGEGAVQP